MAPRTKKGNSKRSSISTLRHGELLEQLRADYMRGVERLAEKLQSRFESRELEPWDGNDDRWEDVDALEVGDLSGRGRKMIPYDDVPNVKLELECWRKLGRGDAKAALILAVSPRAEPTIARHRGINGPEHYGFTSLRWGAAEAMAADLVELARNRGWLPAEVRSAAAQATTEARS